MILLKPIERLGGRVSFAPPCSMSVHELLCEKARRYGAIYRAMWHNLTEVLPMQTTRLSTKGQIILPKGIRVSRAWGPGTEFTVEETDDGILLRPTACFPEANLDDVSGFLRSKRKSKAPAQLRAAVDREVKRRHDRGRY